MSHTAGSRSLLDQFSALEDPCQRWRAMYPFRDPAGAAERHAVEHGGLRRDPKDRQDFLRRFLPYECGVPSHGTLGNVINALGREQFKRCLLDRVLACATAGRR